MCLYGIELLPDNIAECRANLLDVFAEYLRAGRSRQDLYRAAFYVLSQNLVHGNAMTMLTQDGRPTHLCRMGLTWGRAGFNAGISALDSLTQSSAFGADPTCSSRTAGKHESLTPTKTTYRPMTVRELASATPEAML